MFIRIDFNRKVECNSLDFTNWHNSIEIDNNRQKSKIKKDKEKGELI